MRGGKGKVREARLGQAIWGFEEEEGEEVVDDSEEELP